MAFNQDFLLFFRQNQSDWLRIRENSGFVFSELVVDETKPITNRQEAP